MASDGWSTPPSIGSSLPFSVPKPNWKGEDTVMEGDEGVYPTTAEKLAKLKPVKEGGTVTAGRRLIRGLHACNRSVSWATQSSSRIVSPRL